MKQRAVVVVSMVLALAGIRRFVSATSPDEPLVKPQGDLKQLLAAPASPAQRDAWLTAMIRWREAERVRLSLPGGPPPDYIRPEFLWTRRSFIQPLMMAEDRFFYDPVRRRYTVDRYLDDLDNRYGGIDCILIWPTYPNIGIDDRNQHDLLRDMPGGYEGLKSAVESFHRRGVRVIFPIMPWDVGTRDEGVPLHDALARSIGTLKADALNGDTLFAIPREYRETSDHNGWPLAVEPEVGLSADEKSLAWTNVGWGYWWNYTAAPGVDRYKWIEPYHLTHVCDRWSHDRTDQLQYAFFNGDGYVSWENIWSIWNGVTLHDSRAIRRISAIYRTFPHMLTSRDWEPFYPTLQSASGVYASRFPGSRETLYTLINRWPLASTGPQLTVRANPAARFYDLWNGEELHPEVHGGLATLSFSMEVRGYGAVLVDTGPPSATLRDLLKKNRAVSAQPAQASDSGWRSLAQRMVPIATTRAVSTPPPGMVRIPGGQYRFRVSGVEIERSEGNDVQYSWEDSPRLDHDHTLIMKPFCIDRLPVTNAEFKRFVDAAHYRPADDHNFLKDWRNGTFQEGWAERPVTWISVEDARAYARWAGKRLPHEWEWQLAAQGKDGRLYPWGNTWDAAAVPPPDTSRTRRPPTESGAFPRGASPYGVLDMVGNIWQWTDEFQDSHTRTAVLRGGSYYLPQGSGWYFPQAYRLDRHGKYLLLAPCKDRAGTIGFRCVVDAAAGR